MALAQRLNELAIANSEGLLKYVPIPNDHIFLIPTNASDDEYRLLRQNVFEQYSGNANLPVESPLVPITAINVQHGRKALPFVIQSMIMTSTNSSIKGVS